MRLCINAIISLLEHYTLQLEVFLEHYTLQIEVFLEYYRVQLDVFLVTLFYSLLVYSVLKQHQTILRTTLDTARMLLF